MTERTDVRVLGRVVASVLLAAGDATADELARANAALSVFNRPALTDAEFVPATPEQLATLVPVVLRVSMHELLVDMALDKPIRRRIAESYAVLWRLDARAAAGSGDIDPA